MKALSRFLALTLTLTGLLLGCSQSKEIQRVKGGTLDLCPNHTVKQMVDGFMGSPSWESGKAESGQWFVNVDGNITFHDAPVRAKLQFIIDGSHFSFNAFEMNGVPSANLVALAMMTKMCESAT
jgi:hypothetical protein